MNNKIFLILLLISSSVFSQNTAADKTKTEKITRLISLFRQMNVKEISHVVNYPLKREYPIPDVKNEADFRKRFNQIFDKKIVAELTNSKPGQWSEVGWRGTMLNNGDLWIDEDGKITAVNYQSNFEKNQKKELINKEKNNLYVSLKTYQSPVYKFTTKSYLIRIDELNGSKYRYASWKLGKKESQKPDLIITNGIIQMDGSGGNHQITFKQAPYTYSVYRTIIGEKDSPEISLSVEKNNKVILQQDGKLTH